VNLNSDLVPTCGGLSLTVEQIWDLCNAMVEAHGDLLPLPCGCRSRHDVIGMM